MARKPRIYYPGALYHVMFRGNAGQSIFSCDEDRFRFFLLLQEGTLILPSQTVVQPCVIQYLPPPSDTRKPWLK
jgi:hypothetical protein